MLLRLPGCLFYKGRFSQLITQNWFHNMLMSRNETPDDTLSCISSMFSHTKEHPSEDTSSLLFCRALLGTASHISPLDAEQHHLYSEPLLDDWASWSVSKGEPSHPEEETHFGYLYPQSRSVGHYPKLVNIGESRNVDQAVNRELCVLAQLLLHHDRPMKSLHHCWCRISLSGDLSLHLSSLMNKTPRNPNSSTWGKISFPTRREHSTLYHGLGLGGAEPHPRCFTLDCRLF